MPSVADFIVERLENAGVKHVMGVPGDYCLSFCKKLTQSKKLTMVNNTDEGLAGFAADAYARINGIGCVVATYNVGALKLCNAIAGAYAERSPVVVISGAPGLRERDDDFILHHMVRGFDNQRNIFENITCYSVILDDPTKAGFQIDEALEKLKFYKQPVYLELPRDIADKAIQYDVYRQLTPVAPPTEKIILQEALKEVMQWLTDAERPVILAGVQLGRYNLQELLLRFAEKHNIPIITTMLSKSVVDEKHPLFLGVYVGSGTEPNVQKVVAESDCCLIFGEMLSDITVGFQRAKFDHSRTAFCAVEGLRIRNHTYQHVGFADFCTGLFKSDLKKHEKHYGFRKVRNKYVSVPVAKITVQRVFDKIDSILTPSIAVLADVGDSMFGSMGLNVSDRRFICPAFYASMGFAIPGALGATLARPKVRPIVLVGDGGFQMSCTELSTFVRLGLAPIVVVLNNKGYQTERLMLDGPFNDILDWNYHKIVTLLGNGTGYRVETEGQFEEAMTKSLAQNELAVINVILDSKDRTDALQRTADGFSNRI